MDKAQRKIRRSPSFKRKSKVLPVGQKLTLERVLGLTVTSNAAFSCDPVNGTIAYPAGCVVVLFNPRRNRQSHIFNVSKKTITSVAFSGDGKHLVTGECGHQPAVRVWDVEEKTQVAEFHGHKFGVNCVAFSPNLKYIVSIGSQHDMMVNVWNWRTGNKVASNKVSCKVSAVSFGADSATFVTVGNRHVKFWYLDSSKSKINQTVPLLGRSGILGEQKNNFFCDVVCGQGRYAGSTYVITQSGLLCEFNEKRLLDKWVELRTKSANCLAAGEEHIYIGCAEGVVRVFSAASLHFIATLPHPHHLGVEVATATSSSDMICTQTDAKYPDVMAITMDDDHKKVACIYNDHSLYVWDVLNMRRVGKACSFLFHSGCVWALEVYPRLENNQTGVLPPGSFLTASSDDTIRVWNLDPQMRETPGYKHNIYSSELLKVVYTDPSLAFLCDVNYNPAGATDKTDTTWDGKNGVRSIRVSPDGEHLASGDRQGNIRIYDLQQMSEIKSIEAHESDVVCLEYSFSKIGPPILASGSRDRLIHVFDVEQQYGLLQTLDDHSAAIQSVRFTDANNKLRMLSCGSDKSLLFRNASLNPGFEFSLDQHLVSKATMYDMIIDPTQKFVATACQDRNIRVYNMATAKQKKNYRGSIGDDGTLLRVQLDPSGTYAATSCTDKNLCVLEFYTGEMSASASGHSEIATGLRFTNDLKHLISVSADGCIFVWRLCSDMSKTMRSRMEELGKMPREESFVSDLRKESSLMPNTASLDGTFVKPLPDFPIMKENISPSRVLSSMDTPPSSSSFSSSAPTAPSSFPTTPLEKRAEANNPAQQPSADCHFSVGPLPNWAKKKFEDVKDGSEGESDSVQPKGRWAQRFDQNLAFKSQLDLSQLDDDADGRRLTTLEGGGGLGGGGLHSQGDLATSMPDLRRETVVLSQQHTPAKNIPIIDDDDETNIDDEEDFFPAFIKNKLPGVPAESDRSSSDHEDRRRMRQSDPIGRRSGVGDPRRWGSRASLGNEDRANAIDFDDTDDPDSWSETTEVIYPPSEPESVDTFASTFQVFAADGARKTAKRTSNINVDEDSESTDHVSLEDQDDDEANEEALPTSSSSTPSDPEREFMPSTPDKELFLKENFESVSFTPVAMDKFAQQVATLERATEVSDAASMPFSPRLSLSSRFLSRSQFGAARPGGGLGGGQRPDSWFDMNWRTGGLLQESPEKEDPPSPPTKLDSKEPSFSTPKTNTSADLGLCGSPSPRTLRRFWADFPLSHQPIKEEHPLPRIPIPHSISQLKAERGSPSPSVSMHSSKIPLSHGVVCQATCSAELQPLSPPCSDRPRFPLCSVSGGSQSPRVVKSHDQTPVGISGGTPPQSVKSVKSPDVKRVSSSTPTSTPPHSPRLSRSSASGASNSGTTPPQSPRSCRSRVTTRPPRSPLSPDLRSPQSPKSPHSPLSPKPPVCPSSPRSPRPPLSIRSPRSGQAVDQVSPLSPKPPRSPGSTRPVRSSSLSPDLRSPGNNTQPPKKPPRCLPPLRSLSSSPSRSAPPSPSSSGPPSPSPDSNGEGKQAPKKPPRTLVSLRSRSKSPQSPSRSQPHSPSSSSHVDSSGVRESVRTCCRSRSAPAKSLASESSGTGDKLEGDNSPIPASPTRPSPSSPLRGSSLAAARDKRRSGNGVRSAETNGGSTSSTPPPRQVPSYFRTTKSSRLKSSSSGNLLKQAEVQNAKTSSSNTVQSNKTEGPAKKRIGKGRLSSSRLAMYASTPNLTDFHEDKEEAEEEEVKADVETSSNLRCLADLSLSVPDVNCLDDPVSTDSSSSSGPVHRDKDKTGSGRQGNKSHSPSRRSLPAAGLAGAPLSLPNQSKGLSDAQLMPPPPTTVQPLKAAQSSLLRRAVQVRKRSTSELTLEQAKSILLGNSGILGTQQTSPEEESPTSNQLPGEQLMKAVSPHKQGAPSALSSRSPRSSSSTSTLHHGSSSIRSSSSTSTVFDSVDHSGYTSANTLAVAEEIDRTANQLRREREQAAAAALDASRYDPPERDQPSPRKAQTAAQVSSSRGVMFSDSATDREVFGSGDDNDDSPKLSVQERIARLNQKSPPRGSPESVRLSREGGRGQSPSSQLKVGGGRSSVSPAPCEQPASLHHRSPAEQHVSPRSQSDTGLGSDTDTDSDMRYHQHAQRSGDTGAARGDRSRLSLHLPESSSPQSASSSSSSEDSLRTCMSVVSDLKLAVERAKDFLSQMTRGQNSSKGQSPNQHQMATMLSEAFREAHLTLAHLALQSPVAPPEGEAAPIKPPSCPLVEEGGAAGGWEGGPWDSSVMDKARDMLQPFMSHLSRELSEELVKMVRERLDTGRPPPPPPSSSSSS
ncbi:uncharacterized protein LOC143281273 isoform X2 [Babylonia areolata]|uniref:uncharacterized protein LOC143281273 isoform X2 n=1 Tax=Babylonia areolata TaxID=304850 RepID=UPI003FD3F2A3